MGERIFSYFSPLIFRNIMKHFVGLFLVAVVFSTNGCGSSGSGASGEVADSTSLESLPPVLAEGTVSLDLSEYFMPFSIYVPDSNRGIPEIEDTGFGETIVRVGKTFNMVIAEGGDIAMKKAEIADDLMFTNDITEEGEGYFVYKSTIKDSHLEPEYHFYAVKSIGGRQYEFRDNKDEGPFSESIATFMVLSVRHIIPNKEV